MERPDRTPIPLASLSPACYPPRVLREALVSSDPSGSLSTRALARITTPDGGFSPSTICLRCLFFGRGWQSGPAVDPTN